MQIFTQKRQKAFHYFSSFLLKSLKAFQKAKSGTERILTAEFTEAEMKEIGRFGLFSSPLYAQKLEIK
jgi:hypothetical protein